MAVQHSDGAGIAAAFSRAPALGMPVFLATICLNLLGLALPLSILQVYDRVLPRQSGDTLFVLAIFLLLVIVLDTTLRISRYLILGRTAAKATHQASIHAVNCILNAKPAAIERNEPSIHLERLEGLAQLNDYYGGQSRLYLIDAPFAILFLLLTALIGGTLVLAPLTVCAVFSTIIFAMGRRLRTVVEQRAEMDRRRYDFIIDTLSGIKTVKLMAMNAMIERRFERLSEQTAQLVYRSIISGSDVQATGNLFANLTMIATVSVGALMVNNHSLSVGELASCTLLSGRATEPLLKMFGFWTELQQVNLRQARAAELLKLEQEQGGEDAKIPQLRGHLRIEDTDFRFDDAETSLFEGIDVDIKPGEIIGITGNDGCGKTTLVKLLRGELSPNRGRITLDGHEVSGKMRRALLQHVAYAPQRGVLFSGTILENITMFGSACPPDQAIWAARLIGLESDINRLPNGYSTQLSDGATLGSPDNFGQRIVIARALARRPALLIFDEANALLDRRSDKLVLSGLEELRGTATLILITRRPSYLAIADRAFSLTDGRLVAYDPALAANASAATTPSAAKSA